MVVNIIYSDKKDKEFVSKIDTDSSFFVNFLDVNNSVHRKKALRLMNYWGAKKIPFICIDIEENSPAVVFYSEVGESAINQFIKYINGNKNKNT